MKIAIIGETRLPVLDHGGGGLGRATHEIAADLLELGHSVTLFAMPGSEFAGELRYLPQLPNMVGEYDVLLDYSHTHEFSRNVPNSINLIGDRECQYIPRNALVESKYMQSLYPGSKIALQGCKVDDIPFSDKHGDYLIFMGANVAHKGPDIARGVAEQAGKEIVFIGPGFREVSEAEKWELLGGALALLCPYTIDASPRAPLEAAACGTPTICLEYDGTQDHVLQGVSGFTCVGTDDMVFCISQLGTLSPRKMRDWVKETHDNKVTILEIERYIKAVVSGERW